jgi:NAD(P)-dependent dehydrogenase (short-subunit alcohol dehydrogenase family)
MKTVLLTGGSSGFGKMAVSLLLERGHTVIAALRGGESRLEKIFRQELREHPGKLIALDLHMEKPETFDSAARLVANRFGGKLDVLVNNAGYGLFGTLEDFSEPQLRHQMEVNFFGPAFLTRALLPALRSARGRVINISSVAGRHSFPGYAAYNASKFSLEGLCEAMHYDLKPHGVQVALIEPGGFKTDFTTRSQLFGEGAFLPSSPYRARNEALSHFLATSSDRLGNPARVAKLIVCFAEKRRLPLRRRIGADSWFMLFFAWVVPARLRMAMLDRVFRLVIFKD